MGEVIAVADTHTAVWYLFNDPRLSFVAGKYIDDASSARRKIAVSAVTLAELVYLVEKNRLPPFAYSVLVDALQNTEHVFAEAEFTVAIADSMRSIPRADVPDMPDRMIAATAIHLGIPILSRDRRIRSANLNTIW